MQNKSIEMEQANLAAMRLRKTVVHYAAETYTHPAEQMLYDSIAESAAGKPILDIGVGGGRTVPLLTAISTNYTAVDYSPEMVAAFKQRFPGLRILHANAVDLSAFDDASMFLVVFSCCGIDMVGHADRRKILHEVRRVLAPGGAFIFSTHNLESRLQDLSIRDIVVPIDPTLNPLKLTWGVARSARRVWNYHKLKPLTERHEDWAILNSEYHAFGTLMHYITVGAQRSDLAEAGFAPDPLVYNAEASPILGDSSPAPFLHWIARVPELSTPGM
jgi:SAM-dependent methyltransferase